MTIQLHIDTQTQALYLMRDGQMVRSFLVSTAKNGTGQAEGSGCTPLGKHQISEKFGDGLPNNAVFVARRFTGELYDDNLACEHPERDWILGRILWLDGCEEGVNKGYDANDICVDTKSRYVYIHGTPDTEPMGVPMSHGCVRMRNEELVWLYDQVAVGCEVIIR
ncbi:L,D-transpeptidase [Moraxella sp. RCAD0137]|uniref:L,D-transpeptidase n=1 Tax=Moraxella sp. RCAD0137 TaxID=1775913 RepID=UPI000C9F4DFF|nr:L,D-transpeptidase [Moraxella sp. RCAD0137]PNP99223.1 peptidase [Moraxella sp. RCAD0137]